MFDTIIQTEAERRGHEAGVIQRVGKGSEVCIYVYMFVRFSRFSQALIKPKVVPYDKVLNNTLFRHFF